MLEGIPTPRIVVSKRAKCVRLKVCAFRGLVVSIPPSFDRRQIPAILNKQRAWIEKSLEQARKYRAEALEKIDAMPETIDLAASGEVWTVVWSVSPQGIAARADWDQKTMTVNLATPEPGDKYTRALLQRFVIQRAKIWLEPELRRISSEVGLPFNRFGVRIQATRWGSCSAKKNISLNAKLMFLEPGLVRHILLHELAHTKVMNHSAAYHDLLEKLSPNHRKLETAVRKAKSIPPGWMDAKLEASNLPPL